MTGLLRMDYELDLMHYEIKSKQNIADKGETYFWSAKQKTAKRHT
jgi:hypothetical protein